MYITKEKYQEICNKYSSIIFSEEDVEDALNFVNELLEAEADAIKAVEPEACATINRLESAAYEVFDLCNQVSNREFGFRE